MHNQPADSSRPKRVAALIKKEVAQILQREMNDPRLADITLTAVDVSRDLASAKIYFTTMSAANPEQELSGLLNKAAGYIRNCLKGRLELRGIPQLRFKYDESLQRGADIDRLFEGLHREDNQ